MKPFDDTLPEEQEIRQRDLIELVQRARRNPLLDGSAEQDQVIARVRQRLADLGYMANQSGGRDLRLRDTAMQPAERELEQAGAIRSMPVRSPGAPEATSHRRQRSWHLLNTLAAVLVVGLLISASLVLFRRSPQLTTNGAAIGPVGTPTTVRVASGGLELSMSVTPGPYFLSELLAVDMSLTNHSSRTYQIAGARFDTPCLPALRAVLTGGSSPHFTLFAGDNNDAISCPHVGGASPLQPGQTISIHHYVPLTSSGPQTLTTQLFKGTSDAFNLFNKHWPLLKLNVAPVVPVDRHGLSLHQRGSTVTIIAPPSVHLQFAYLYSVICENAQGAPAVTQGPGFIWSPLSTNILNKPLCVDEIPLPHERWRFVVGAPGYAIVTGDFSA